MIRIKQFKLRKKENREIIITYTKSQQSQTVEKWPQPNLRTTWYRL
jgi:hypothetical protein